MIQLLRWYFNIISVIAAGFLFFNFAYAPWSWNPIENLLYVRNAGFILPANHISSSLAIAGTALFFALRDFGNAGKWIFVIFSTASIHEYILDALNIPAMIAGHTLGYTITFRWFFWLGFFLVPGIYLANKRQRKILAQITIFCLCYIGSWVFMASYFGFDTYTILAYAPGPAYHDFVPNFFEVTSWIIPAAMWWA